MRNYHALVEAVGQRRDLHEAFAPLTRRIIVCVRMFIVLGAMLGGPPVLDASSHCVVGGTRGLKGVTH